tara:strand:+ start:1057 stop:1374 length:318 start_codon:yes stop_codon:yes gene_type:complete
MYNEEMIKMNNMIIKLVASGLTSTLLTSMVATWYVIQEFLGEQMAMQLLIPAYCWSLLTLWGDEIKDALRSETIDEVKERLEEFNENPVETSIEFASRQLPKYNK